MLSFGVPALFPMSLCVVHACSVDVRVPSKRHACPTACLMFVSGSGVALQQTEESCFISFPMSVCIVHACSVDARVPSEGNA